MLSITVLLTIVALSAFLYNRFNPLGFHNQPLLVGAPTNTKPFSLSSNSFWIEAVVEAVSSAFKLRQQKRESDKETNRQRAQQKADLAMLEQQNSLAKGNENQTNQPMQSFLAGSSRFLPLAVIGGIAAFGLMLFKRK